jgi:hypothetical protein
MQTFIQLIFPGNPDVTKPFASALGATRGIEIEQGVSIDWETPTASFGMTETTVELLGLLGVTSFPIAVLAGVIANLMTRNLGRAKSQIARSDPRVAAEINRIELRVVVTRGGSSVEVEVSLAQPPEQIKAAITDGVKRLSTDS